MGYDFARIGASVRFLAECGRNRYPESVLGLQRDRSCTRGIDLDYSPARNVSFAAYYLEQETTAATAGMIGYAGPDWRYLTADGVDTAGLRLGVEELKQGRLEVTVDVVRSRGAGRYVTERGDESVPFPTLVSNITALDLNARYRLARRGTLVFQLRHERYSGADWAFAATGAIRNVLAFGEMPPRYAANRVGLAYVVVFGHAN